MAGGASLYNNSRYQGSLLDCSRKQHGRSHH
nr:MAG TPA: hypothetical protein [Caudoviricetes sp.]